MVHICQYIQGMMQAKQRNRRRMEYIRLAKRVLFRTIKEHGGSWHKALYPGNYTWGRVRRMGGGEVFRLLGDQMHPWFDVSVSNRIYRR